MMTALLVFVAPSGIGSVHSLLWKACCVHLCFELLESAQSFPLLRNNLSREMSLVATFDEVVDAQSSHYAVPAVVIVSIVKKVQNFFKVVSLIMDKKKNRMWCEAVGPQTDMETLHKSLPAGKSVFFKSLCYKRSPWHSGGKFLDLSKKQRVKVDPLPPVHEDYNDLQKVKKEPPNTLGTIAGLRGLDRGHKADLTGRICSFETKMLKDGKDRDGMSFIFDVVTGFTNVDFVRLLMNDVVFVLVLAMHRLAGKDGGVGQRYQWFPGVGRSLGQALCKSDTILWCRFNCLLPELHCQRRCNTSQSHRGVQR